MPRGIGLTQEQKNAVFKTHRLLGKVLPTAKKHRVARSTVLAVLREFESAGFSRSPRLSLSPEVLLQLQTTHLDDVIRGVKDYQPSAFAPPHEYKGSTAKAAIADRERSFALPSQLRWHVSGTTAETLFAEAQAAISTYDGRCADLWGSVRSAISDQTGIATTIDYVGVPESVEVSFLWSELIDKAYEALFLSSVALAEGWAGEPLPGGGGGDAQLLRWGGRAMAVVREEGAKAFSDGIEAYEATDRGMLAGEAHELSAQYHELLYLAPIVGDALRSVTAEEIKGNMCPACPYPEGEHEALSQIG